MPPLVLILLNAVTGFTMIHNQVLNERMNEKTNERTNETTYGQTCRHAFCCEIQEDEHVQCKTVSGQHN